MASPARFERTAPRLGIWCSIRLSYGDHHTQSLYHPAPRANSPKSPGWNPPQSASLRHIRRTPGRCRPSPTRAAGGPHLEQIEPISGFLIGITAPILLLNAVLRAKTHCRENGVTLAHHQAIVIGAGVVGLSTALYLQRGGLSTAVIDPLPPAGGSSFGNAGLLSPDTAVPIALPGMLRKVPGWLTDPLGPLSVRPAYFPKAFPWLMQWIKAGHIDRVMTISDAMRALHKDSLSVWQDLLGNDLYRDLIRPAGQVQVWEGSSDSANSAVEQAVRDRHGIKTETLTTDDLRQMFPGISHIP